MSRPNIVWILSDQHRADAWGAASDGIVHTPALDCLAAGGTTFGQAFCQGPLCVPSRASLLTQRYVEDHGVRDNSWRGFRDDLPTTVRAIRDVGYHTVAIGKMHLYKYPPDVADGAPTMHRHGFVEVDEMLGKYGNAFGRSRYTDDLEAQGFLADYRRFLTERNPHSRASLAESGQVGKPHWVTDPAPMPAPLHPDAWLGRQVADWIGRYRSAKPFFLWVGFPGPHDPWDAPVDYVRRYAGSAIPRPDTGQPPHQQDGRFGEFIREVRDYGSSDTATAEAIQEVRRHYYAGVTMIDEAIARILEALEQRGLMDDTWIVYTSDHGEMLGDHGLFTKNLFYDSATRVPLIVRPPGGIAPRRVDDLVELVDVAATVVDVAGAEPVAESAGRSLQGAVLGQPFDAKSVVRSECRGFQMWRSDCHKVIIDEMTGEPVQMFDLCADPFENHNLVGVAGYENLVARLSAALRDAP